MVQAGELLRITEAEFNLEPCAVILDDVSSWHVKVCREVDLVTARLRIVYPFIYIFTDLYLNIKS